MRPLPLALRAVNVIGRRRSPRAFEPDELLHVARNNTGLDDIGRGLTREGLERLCRALNEEAELTPTGRLLARSQILGALGNRLRIVDWLRRHPETVEERIERPVFIVGLPRTGTTMLQRLLAANPAHRAAQWWEGAEPCPPPATVRAVPDPRIARAERTLRLVNFAMPDLRRIHEVAAQAPEECVQLMGNDLVSLVYGIQFWVPSYWQWLEDVDLTPAYAAHRHQWQILQWGALPQRWIGKAPAHLFALPALLAAYPDAVIVQTHREPISVVASTCSLLAHTYHATTDRIAPAQIGSLVRDRLSSWQHRFSQDRADAALRSPGATFVDVAYPELVAEPLAELERLYDAAFLPWTPGVHRTAAAHLASHPQHAHGVHRYDLAGFGLTEDEVRAAFQ